MIMGMSIATFTQIHVLISLVGIATGIVVVAAMLRSQYTRIWTSTFLVTTLATSLTGFMFGSKFGPPHAIGAISLVVLAVSVTALYGYRLQGPWRWIYVVSAALALYLNFFIAVVQAFQKIAFFHALAPTQAEPPFALAQGLLLVAFTVLGVIGSKRFHPYRDGLLSGQLT